jgi:hypothetical protein
MDYDICILRTVFARISTGDVISFEQLHRSVWHLVNAGCSGYAFHEICIALWHLATTEPIAPVFWYKASTIRNACSLLERTESVDLKSAPSANIMHIAALCRIIAIQQRSYLWMGFRKLVRNLIIRSIRGKSKRRWADMC